MNVLMIDADSHFTDILDAYLSKFNIKLAKHADPTNIATSMANYDCVILDLHLPKMDGFELCKQIRAKSQIPIIISTKSADLSDEILALQIGADDYLVKPYEPKKLHARLSALMRRTKQQTMKNAVFSPVGSAFELNDKAYEIRYKGEPLRLTPAEFEILKQLIINHGAGLGREQIIKQCKSMKGKSLKSLDVIVGRLRAKIKDNPKNLKHILAVRGVGYKLLG